MKKKCAPVWIRTPAARMLGNRSKHSTNLPLRKILSSLLYLKGCLLIATKQVVVFLGQYSDRRKNHGCGQKKPEGTSSAIIGAGPLRNTANSSVVPTEFAARNRQQS